MEIARHHGFCASGALCVRSGNFGQISAGGCRFGSNRGVAELRFEWFERFPSETDRRGTKIAIMKTTVSLPDVLFRQAEAAAQKLQVSRSQIYAQAMSFWSVAVLNGSLKD